MSEQELSPKVSNILDKLVLTSKVVWNYAKQLPSTVRLEKDEETGLYTLVLKKPQLALPAPPVSEDDQKLHKMLRDVDDVEEAKIIEQAHNEAMNRKAEKLAKQQAEEELRKAQIEAEAESLESELEAITATMREVEAQVAEAESDLQKAQQEREKTEGWYHNLRSKFNQYVEGVSRAEKRALRLTEEAHDCNDAVAKAAAELKLLEPEVEALHIQLMKPPVAEGQDDLVQVEVSGSDLLLKVKPTERAKKTRTILLQNVETFKDVHPATKGSTTNKVTAYLVGSDLQQPSMSNGSGYVAEGSHSVKDDNLVLSTYALQPALLRVVTVKEEGRKAKHTLQVTYDTAEGNKNPNSAMVLRIDL